MTHRYSPLPIEAYRLQGIPRDEIGAILDMEEAPAIWNLFWLSVPMLDFLPDAGPKWWTVYSPEPGACAALTKDVLYDEVLYRKLMMHPLAFIDWFERADHMEFGAYEALGGAAWVETVLCRAGFAADRLTAAKPPVSIQGNVLTVDFRRAA